MNSKEESKSYQKKTDRTYDIVGLSDRGSRAGLSEARLRSALIDKDSIREDRNDDEDEDEDIEFAKHKTSSRHLITDQEQDDEDQAGPQSVPFLPNSLGAAVSLSRNGDVTRLIDPSQSNLQ